MPTCLCLTVFIAILVKILFLKFELKNHPFTFSTCTFLPRFCQNIDISLVSQQIILSDSFWFNNFSFPVKSSKVNAFCISTNYFETNFLFLLLLFSQAGEKECVCLRPECTLAASVLLLCQKEKRKKKKNKFLSSTVTHLQTSKVSFHRNSFW